MERVSFIPCLTWVQQGKAKPNIEKVKHTKEELKEIVKELKLKEAEYESRPNNEPKQQAQPPDPSDQEEEDEISKLYGMDNYDDEDEDVLGAAGATDYGIESLILNNSSESDSEDTDVEEDEFSVNPEDNLILMGHVESDVCMLEVYVFNNAKAELFLLHDIFLPSYPICIEWLDYNPKESENRGNFAAVGGMTPDINVWDLNVSGCLEAAFQLGGKKTKKSQRHTDAVLDLSWCPENRNVLASASADKSVLLWDMSQLTSVLRLSHFEDKVQAAKFHSVESHSLLTGGCDGKVRLYDCRSPTTFKTWEFSGEIERILWNQFEPMCYFASTEKGFVYQVDVRMTQPLWTLKAHAVEVTGLALSSHCKDLLLTGGMDEAVKVWDLKDNKPQFVTEKAMHIGQILTLSGCPNVPYVFCAGGNKKDNFMYLWDIRENDTVLQRFQDRNLEETSYNHSQRQSEVEPMNHNQEEPHPCSSSSLHPRNNQSRLEGALQKHKKKWNKELRAMHQDERDKEATNAAAVRRKQKEKERKRLRREQKKLNPKDKESK